MGISWKSWRLGLFVAIITGLCAALAGGMIFPNATWKQLVVVLLGSIAKDVMLFLAQHPADAVVFDSKTVATATDGGVSTTITHATVTTPEPPKL